MGAGPGGRVHRLRDGRRVLVRPLVPGDRAELAARYEELSEMTRRLRFFQAPDHLSPKVLDHLLDLDGVDRFALSAWMLDEPSCPGVGVARFTRDPHDRTNAEAAAVVVDAYQHVGIGRLLLFSLVDEALARGITSFTASIRWENEDLLGALHEVGAVVTPDEPGVADVVVPLPLRLTIGGTVPHR